MMTRKKGSAEIAIRDICRATRRRNSAEEKIRIVLQGLRGKSGIVELCCKEDINRNLCNIERYHKSLDNLTAKAPDLTGTLAVQTIGVAGESIATSLSLPNKLDQTRIENATLATGSRKAILYRSGNDRSGFMITPRIVRLCSPIGENPRLINEIYAELSRNES